MLDTPDEPLMDVVDFDLTRHLDAPLNEDENLFLAAQRSWQRSRQRLFELLRDAPAIDTASSREQLDQQWQAYWNARAGVERYTDSRQVPASSVYDFGAAGAVPWSKAARTFCLKATTASSTGGFC